MTHPFQLGILFSLLMLCVECYIVPDPVQYNYHNSYNEFNDLRVATDLGLVQGEIKPGSVRTNFQIRQFIGIPYAQKPIDIYRFSKPQPYVPETFQPNTIINTRQEVKCYQARNYRNDAYVKLFENIPESEDCLYLNVYAPRIRINGPKFPVIVYLHGGEFKVGSKYIKNPEQLVDTQTIVVSINYRLGIFGFLSYDNEYLPGNLGIHDVILALKWINREITRFNGDTNMVTLFGHDSGAIIANLLMVSNFAEEFNIGPNQRLFHRVILSGGSIFSPFALDYFPRYQTQMLTLEVGCGQHQFNGRNLLQCLREKSPSELLKTLDIVKSDYIKDRQLYLPDGPIPDLDFRPIIDANRTWPLFRGNPIELFENDEYQKEIPVIVVLTEYEGSHYLYQMENELRLSSSTSSSNIASPTMYTTNQLNFTDIVARLISPYLRPDSNLGALSSAVFYQYYTEYIQRHNGITNKQIFDQEAFQITASMMGDFLQYGPVHRMLKRHSLNSPLAKLYIFDFGNRNEVMNRRCVFWPNAQFFRCPTHSEDIYYLFFNQQSGPWNPSANLITLIKQFSHAEQMEQLNYYSPNRPGFFYRRLNANRSPGINFRSLESMQFWSEHFVRLQQETIHENLYFPVLQYKDFQIATYSLAIICSLLFVLLFGIGVFLYRKRSEEKRTLKLLKARNVEIQQRYEENDQLEEL